MPEKWTRRKWNEEEGRKTAITTIIGCNKRFLGFQTTP
jgi:hypothetical protein